MIQKSFKFIDSSSIARKHLASDGIHLIFVALKFYE